MESSVTGSATPIDVDRVIYATITLMSVLIVYDGWARLQLLDVVLIIVGPIIAVFTSHVFSTTLVEASRDDCPEPRPGLVSAAPVPQHAPLKLRR